MFEWLADFRRIIVTGPHRSGTTIAAEMIASDTGKPCIREEAFDCRNIILAERSGEGVIQGPYLLPWAPIFAGADTAVIYMRRDGAAIDASVRRLKEGGISEPLFHWNQAWRLWQTMDVPNGYTVDYKSLRDHPLWVERREGWGHRQTR
ncbi:MAG TPA: hypothetical protein VK973_17175 [Arenicellales bacterium]|nr:hypothetical protein [Arenicellales bacterium]